MSKPLKRMVSEDLRRKYEGVDSACVVDLTGLNVQKTQDVRRDLTQKQIRLEVVKNSMARLAFCDGPLEPLARALVGPNALVTGGDSIIEVARALMQWSKEFKEITLKQAIVEGDADLLEVEQLSKMQGRRELIGEVAMLISSPGRAIAGCLSSPQAKIAGCLKAMADKEEEEQEQEKEQ
ncbi:MAG: 50S ribosomal protein L10 [Phycisphaerae bacterium]|nr:50S ribosomal protein L10 [Phycisphaerae bacterium]